MDLILLLLQLAREIVEAVRDGKDDPEALRSKLLQRLAQAQLDLANLEAVQEERWRRLDHTEEPTKP